MNTLDTERTSFGRKITTHGNVTDLVYEMFSYWERMKEANPGSVVSNDVKDPITMVKEYADSLLTSRDTYWKERVRETEQRYLLTFAGLDPAERHDKAVRELKELDNLK